MTLFQACIHFITRSVSTLNWWDIIICWLCLDLRLFITTLLPSVVLKTSTWVIAPVSWSFGRSCNLQTDSFILMIPQKSSKCEAIIPHSARVCPLSPSLPRPDCEHALWRTAKTVSLWACELVVWGSDGCCGRKSRLAATMTTFEVN